MSRSTLLAVTLVTVSVGVPQVVVRTDCAAPVAALSEAAPSAASRPAPAHDDRRAPRTPPGRIQ